MELFRFFGDFLHSSTAGELYFRIVWNSLDLLQISKLHSELEIVNGNVQVMSEMLTELNPGSDPSDIDLLQVCNFKSVPTDCV